jgi:hypothetical protein
MPAPLYAAAAATASDGLIYITGGHDSALTTLTDAIYIYSPGTDSWTAGAVMPVARYGHTSAAGPDGRIYVFGGYDTAGQPLTSVYAFDPAADTWASVASMPTGRILPAAALAANDRIYVIDGADAISSFTNAVYVYHPDTDTWASGPSTNTSRYALAAASVYGHIYAIGGLDPNTGVTNTVELLFDQEGVVTASATVTVNNVAPDIELIELSLTSINEGQSVTVTGTFSDPALGVSTEIFTGSALWSDGVSTTLTVNADGTFSTTRTFADDDPTTGTPSDDLTVDITIQDDDTGSDTETSNVLTVHNLDPEITSLAGDEIDEDGTATVSGTFHDDGTLDSHTVVISWGPGEGSTTLQALDLVSLGNGDWSFSATHQYLDDKPTGTASDVYTIGVVMTDDDTGTDTDSTTTTVTNVAPVINWIELGDNDIEEGGSTTLTIEWSDPGTQDTYTVTIDWGDGTIDVVSEPASGSGSSMQTYTHTYRDDGGTVFVDSMSSLGWLNMTPGNGTTSDVYAIGVTVTDDDMGSDGNGASITVNNVAPTLSAIENVPLTCDANECNTTWVVSGQFTDPGTDTYRFEINWGDGTIDIFNVPGFNGFPAPDTADIPAPGPYGDFGLVAANFPGSATHSYGAFGTYAITVTVLDDDGGSMSAVVGVVAVETSAEVVSDPVWGTVLDIHGTDFDDHVTVNQSTENGVLVYKVHANSWDSPRTFPAVGVDRILIHLCDGDDHATVSSGVDVGAVIHGDAGNDHLNGGRVAGIVIGGDGDDHLLGGSGKDIFIGGRGADRIVGNTGDDLLIASYTGYDAVDAALLALQGVWNTDASYGSRVATVQNTSNPYYLKTDGANRTVFSDNVVDQLTGSAGSDLFFANTFADLGDDSFKDIITDLKSESALDIDD